MSAHTYPHTPGHRDVDTSIEACPTPRKASQMRARILEHLKDHGPASPDAVAIVFGESILNIRPRFSELYRLKLIEATIIRDKTASGKSSIIWRAC